MSEHGGEAAVLLTGMLVILVPICVLGVVAEGVDRISIWWRRRR